MGGGLWCPDKDALARLRASVDERPHRIRRALMDPAFRDTFLPNAAKYEKGQDNKKTKKSGKTSASRVGGNNGDKAGEPDEAAAVVRAFTEANKENALKTRPKVSSSSFHDNYVSPTVQEDRADIQIPRRALIQTTVTLSFSSSRTILWERNSLMRTSPLLTRRSVL